MRGRLRMVLALVAIVLFTLPLLPVQLVAIRFGRPDPGIIPRLWHKVALCCLGIRVHARGTPAAGRPLLIVANHVSWADICVLSAHARVSFVAKSEMNGWPVFGLLARLQRTVFVERDKPRASGRQVGELGERIASGDAMVLFAEGTTGDGNTVLPFKTSLFAAARSALEAGDGCVATVLVQPVAIAYTRLDGMPMGRLLRPRAAWIGDTELLPHLAGMLARGGVQAELRFADPVAFAPGDDRKALASACEEEIRRMASAILRNPA